MFACRDAITGPRHAFFFLSYPYHTATVYVLPAYHPSAEEAADPKLYASNVRKLMLECGKMQPSNATYKDKLAFYELVNIKKPDSAGAAGDGSNGNGAAAAAASMRGKAE